MCDPSSFCCAWYIQRPQVLVKCARNEDGNIEVSPEGVHWTLACIDIKFIMQSFSFWGSCSYRYRICHEFCIYTYLRFWRQTVVRKKCDQNFCNQHNYQKATLIRTSKFQATVCPTVCESVLHWQNHERVVHTNFHDIHVWYLLWRTSNLFKQVSILWWCNCSLGRWEFIVYPELPEILDCLELG